MAKKKSATTTTTRISDASEKMKALNITMEHIHKDFGTGAIMRLGDDAVEDVEVISSGSIGLGRRTRRGGLPARTHHRDLRP